MKLLHTLVTGAISTTMAVIPNMSFAANEVCEEIDRLIVAAPSGLQILKGQVIKKDINDDEGEDQCCSAKRNLPGAKFCTVKSSRTWNPGTAYTCQWTFRDRTSASAFFGPFGSAVQQCLSPDVWENESSGEDFNFRASLDGGRTLASIRLYQGSGRIPSIVFGFDAYPSNARRAR